ncbi:hypothetical protein HD554DRAFT_2129484, partial [Boletus coccyginus]
IPSTPFFFLLLRFSRSLGLLRGLSVSSRRGSGLPQQGRARESNCGDVVKGISSSRRGRVWNFEFPVLAIIPYPA